MTLKGEGYFVFECLCLTFPLPAFCAHVDSCSTVERSKAENVILCRMFFYGPQDFPSLPKGAACECMRVCICMVLSKSFMTAKRCSSKVKLEEHLKKSNTSEIFGHESCELNSGFSL